MLSVSRSLKEICSFVRPTCDTFTFDIMNIQTKLNSSDCGLFAIACATELVCGKDPVLCHWEPLQMRPHLIQCLVNGTMQRFPSTKKRRIGFGQRVRKSESEKLYCICRLPNDKLRPMIKCSLCGKWYHSDCVKVELSNVESKWKCEECRKGLL